jgi:adenylosuccinate synthase
MTDPQKPREATDPTDTTDAADAPAVRDPGHVRAREISTVRRAAKSHGRAATLDTTQGGTGAADTDRLRRRARFLRERSEARALRDRVQPRRARNARMRQAMRMRTFRW